MKDFQIDALFVVGYPKQEALIPMRINKPAWIGVFPLYLRDPVIFLKIIPEKSPAHLHTEIPDLRQNFLQRPAKKLRIHRFL